MRSKITENLYDEDKISVTTKKELFNVSLYPGPGLPTFNFNFSSYYRTNGLNNLNVITKSIIIIDSEGAESSLIDTTILDNRVDLTSNHLNISMTNQFNFFGKQYAGIHYFILEQEDLVAKSKIQSEGYFPIDASSQSYGISLKSVYNRYWESSIFLNNNIYKYGSLVYDDYIDQQFTDYQFKLIKHPNSVINSIIYGINYSLARGNKYLTQYNFNFGINLEPIKKLNFNIYFDYRIKYLGTGIKSSNDISFRTNIYYDIK